jgi:hypothetical protein
MLLCSDFLSFASVPMNDFFPWYPSKVHLTDQIYSDLHHLQALVTAAEARGWDHSPHSPHSPTGTEIIRDPCRTLLRFATPGLLVPSRARFGRLRGCHMAIYDHIFFRHGSSRCRLPSLWSRFRWQCAVSGFIMSDVSAAFFWFWGAVTFRCLPP